MPPDTCIPLLMICIQYFCILIGWGHINLFQTVQNFEIENDWYFFKSLRANVMQLSKLMLCKCWKITCQISLSFSTNKVIVSEACELSWIKKKKTENIVCMLLTSNPMISCGINLDQMSTWNFSKTTNWTCYTHAILWVFGKITCAHLFQIPLKIMWLL